MITINLALKKQAAGISNEKSGRDLSQVTEQGLEGLKSLPIKKITLPVIIGFAASVWLDSYKENELNEAQNRLKNVTVESDKIQREFSKYRELEQIKKTMDDDERVIRTKLDTVKVLIADRSRTLLGMIALSQSIPEEAWISEIKFENGGIYLKGASRDFNQVSDFLKRLKENPFFVFVELLDTQQSESAGIVNFQIRTAHAEMK